MSPQKPSAPHLRPYPPALTPSGVFKGGLNAFLALSDEATILTPGVHNGHPLGLDQIKDLVETYNPQAQPAPIKLTHADKQKEAYGWVKSLRMGPYTPAGQGKPVTALFATLNPTDAGRQANRSGGYRMKSLEAWPPTHPSNPTPGRWHLKALALLGSDSPACPNLGPLELSADGEDTETPVLLLQADPNPNPGGVEPPPTEGGAMTPEEKARLETAEAKNKELEARLASQDQANQQAQVQTRLDGLVQAGKLTPAQATAYKPILLNLSADGTVTLAEGKTATPREALFLQLEAQAGHGLFKGLRIPAEAPVELADQDAKTKAMNDAVEKHKAAGKSHAEAVSLAAKEVDACK